jgi:hypothetical protein
VECDFFGDASVRVHALIDRYATSLTSDKNLVWYVYGDHAYFAQNVDWISM